MPHNPGTNLCPIQILITVVKAMMKSKVGKKGLVQLTASGPFAKEARSWIEGRDHGVHLLTGFQSHIDLTVMLSLGPSA